VWGALGALVESKIFFMQSHLNPLTARAKTMRENMTSAERRMWFDCLKNFAKSFRKQRPIGRFIVDFYCAELQLVIEIDGASHDSEEASTYDQERTDFLCARGLTVMRFTNIEVMNQLAAVHQKITNWITQTQVPPERGDVTK
jgi:very-short-patch-repair endonuclease